jgi:hypothetical protein
MKLSCARGIAPLILHGLHRFVLNSHQHERIHVIGATEKPLYLSLVVCSILCQQSESLPDLLVRTLQTQADSNPFILYGVVIGPDCFAYLRGGSGAVGE